MLDGRRIGDTVAGPCMLITPVCLGRVEEALQLQRQSSNPFNATIIVELPTGLWQHRSRTHTRQSSYPIATYTALPSPIRRMFHME